MLKDELVFLEKLKDRFISKKDFFATVKDMYNNGLISRAAYLKIQEKKTQKRKSPCGKTPVISSPCGGGTCRITRSPC